MSSASTACRHCPASKYTWNKIIYIYIRVSRQSESAGDPSRPAIRVGRRPNIPRPPKWRSSSAARRQGRLTARQSNGRNNWSKPKVKMVKKLVKNGRRPSRHSGRPASPAGWAGERAGSGAGLLPGQQSNHTRVKPTTGQTSRRSNRPPVKPATARTPAGQFDHRSNHRSKSAAPP